MATERKWRWFAPTLVAGAVAWSPGVVRADSTHTVERGDSLWSIAKESGVTLEALLAANGLRIDSVILPGRTLTVPSTSTTTATTTPTTTTPTTTYVVRRGDGLRLIARNHGVSVDALLAANRLSIGSVIHPGRELTIPGGSPAAPPATAPATTGAPASLPAEVRDHSELVPVFVAAAGEVGLDTDLLMAIGYHESRWRAAAVSSAGALGIMQVMPTTAVAVATLMREPGLDQRDAEDGIRIGAHLLRRLVDQAGGNVDRALAMYAQGVDGVRRNGVSPASQRFIDEIAELRPLFR